MTSLISDMIKASLPELFVEKNVVSAEQTFHRRLAEYEMNIEQQKLLREDLRDLVELTVGRMDIYHLVGALLLAFCIHLFCENHLLVEAEEHELPRWVLTFFLLSNLCATGYLIMAVWLSMHASVASHSTGVKLLTKFARISIPTRQELEEVTNVPLVGLAERFANLTKRFGFSQKDAMTLAQASDARGRFSVPAEEDTLPRMDRADATHGDLPMQKKASIPARFLGKASSGQDLQNLDVKKHSSPDSAVRRTRLGDDACKMNDPGNADVRLTDANAEGEGVPAASPIWQSENGFASEWSATPHPQSEAYADSGFHANVLASQPPVERAIDQGARDSADRKRHFRVFLQEQQRWVNYDAYARVCMSLGINQLLNALAYFIIGTFALKTPRSALIALLGIQLLSLLLLRLDLVLGENACCFAMQVLLLVPVPPIYLAVILCTWDVHMVSEHFLSLLALPAFLLHASWLLLVASVLIPRRASEASELPKQLRTVMFLDVVPLEQDDEAEQSATAKAEECTEALCNARLLLAERIDEVIAEEAEVGQISQARRHTDELEKLEHELKEILAKAGGENMKLKAMLTGDAECPEEAEIRKVMRENQREMDKANIALERFELWQGTPEVHASLAALRAMHAAGWYDEGQKQQIEDEYQSFLEKCKELNLGIAAGGRDRNDNVADETPELVDSMPHPTGTHDVAAEDRVMVRMPAPDLCAGSVNFAGDSSVWVEQGSSRLRHQPPEDRRATSFHEVLEHLLPGFMDRANSLLESMSRKASVGSGSFQEIEMVSQRHVSQQPERPEGPAAPQPALELRRRHGRAPPARSRLSTAMTNLRRATLRSRESLMSHLVAQDTTPTEQLPGALVRRWCHGLALLWILSAFLHSVDYGHHQRSDAHVRPISREEHGHGHGHEFYATRVARRRLVEEYSRENLLEGKELLVPVAWPAPARLFEVVSMYCSASFMVVDSGHRVYAAERGLERAVGAFKEVAYSVEPLGAVACGDDGCDLLSKSDNETWTLAALPARLGTRAAGAASLSLPESWRRVAAARLPCAAAASAASCLRGLALAGWDGERVVVAAAWQLPDESGKPTWAVKPRFSLQPSKDPCPGTDAAQCPASWKSGGAYGQVEALHFGPGGRTLAVLTGGSSVDAWDLNSGSRLGHWIQEDGGRPPHAMCHDGDALLFAHAALGGSGPRLSTAKLPEKLQAAEVGEAAWPRAPRLVARAPASGAEASGR